MLATSELRLRLCCELSLGLLVPGCDLFLGVWGLLLGGLFLGFVWVCYGGLDVRCFRIGLDCFCGVGAIRKV